MAASPLETPVPKPITWRELGSAMLVVIIPLSVCGWVALTYPIGIWAQTHTSGTLDKPVFAAVHQDRRNTHVGYPAAGGLACGLVAAALSGWAMASKTNGWWKALCLALLANGVVLVTISAALWIWWLTTDVQALPPPY